MANNQISSDNRISLRPARCPMTRLCNQMHELSHCMAGKSIHADAGRYTVLHMFSRFFI